MIPPKVKTGGGPPVFRDAHAPIGGLPVGQSGDYNLTWIPVTDMGIQFVPTHPRLAYPLIPTPGRKTH